MNVIKVAAKEAGLDPREVEYQWRTWSGVAHGKSGAPLAVNNVVKGDEFVPGHYRTLRVPRADVVTTAMSTAVHMFEKAAALFVARSGFDYVDLGYRAALRVMPTLPKVTESATGAIAP